MSRGEILSQAQIDILLKAIDSGQTTVKDIREKESSGGAVLIYDFKHPAKFSREHIQTLTAIHEVFARLFSTQLSAQMRLAVQLDVVSVDQLTYDEFMRSITNPTVVSIFDMNPLEGNSILEFTPTTALTIIDRLLGGPGRSSGRARELTDIETSLIAKVVKKGMINFSEAWKTVIPNLSPEVLSIETNPRFVQIVSPQDTVAVISFEVKVGESQGSMRICIPYPTIEPVVQRMSTQIFISSSTKVRDQDQTLKEVRKNVDKLEVRLALILGYTDITVRDLLSLQIGDVISLNTMTNQDLPVIVEQECKFWGRPGTIGNKLAVQITNVISEV